jgi:hypothetical protein
LINAVSRSPSFGIGWMFVTNTPSGAKRSRVRSFIVLAERRRARSQRKDG